MAIVNSEFATELKKYGAKDFEACFSCGNCTATCNLTEKNANFPRMFIRYGMLGLEKEILKSKELWLCYSCGECSENCPRQAAPGEYMAALRRYAIAGYEPTGLTKLIFKSNPFSIIFTLFLSVLLGFFLLTIKPDKEISRWIFNIIPYEVIHNSGLIIFSITGISILWGLVRMIMNLSIDSGIKENRNFSKSFLQLFKELGTMKRYRNCDDEEDAFWSSKHAILRPWFVHWSIMWGFLGLLLATILDFILKNPATDIWLPSRILGTIAGLLLVYGTGIAIYYRIIKITSAYSKTTLADWMFLIFLCFAGITGFWLEASVAFHAENLLNHIVLLLHIIISMELVLLFSFSKFAHAVYRPVALMFLYSKNIGSKK
jgi:nitrate reductase gamma subunit/ferredoxin